MPAQLITRLEFIEYAKRSGVDGFSNADYDSAITRATDRIRQAALNDYTPSSFEALVPSTAPEEMRDHAFALSLDSLTKADGARPPNIDTGRDEAKAWLHFLAGGSTHYDESPNPALVKRRNGGRVAHRRRSDEDVFDRENESQEFNARDPVI